MKIKMNNYFVFREIGKTDYLEFLWEKGME